MADDQAAGLRQLFADQPTQVISFAAAAGQCGCTTMAMQAAASLARSGRKVILVDENEGSTNATSALELDPERDLFNAIFGRALANVVQQVAPNWWAVPAAKAAALLRVDTAKAQSLAQTLMAPLETAAKVVLIDSRVLDEGRLSLLSAQAHHVVVVVAAQADAIKQAYVLIKRLAHERGREGFHLAITRAKSDEEAAKIHANVKSTAKRYLGVRVEYLGNFGLPLPDKLGEALLARLPLGGIDRNGKPRPDRS